MTNEDDAKALQLLEKAVYKAQDSLEATKHFQPFLMLRTDTGKIEIFDNDIEDSIQSYEALEDILTERIKEDDVDVMVLVVDTQIPERFAEDVPMGIRVHLEEKSQRDKKISARYLYVPYELCSTDKCALFVKLHMPIPIGIPAEYIV